MKNRYNVVIRVMYKTVMNLMTFQIFFTEMHHLHDPSARMSLPVNVIPNPVVHGTSDYSQV